MLLCSIRILNCWYSRYLGSGINHTNIYTVRQVTEGLAHFMDGQDPETKRRGVAIAYYSCHMFPKFVIEAIKTLADYNFHLMYLKA